MSIGQRFFTLIEILVVIAVMGILMGMLAPSLQRARQKAKEVRWLAFNSINNRDGDTVLNYNFMYDDYIIRYGNSLEPALRNGAVGCTLEGYEPTQYDGIISGAYEWRKGAGRWTGYNNALQYDGISTYVEVPGEKVLNFDPAGNDFTAMAWVFVDALNSPMTIFSKMSPDGTATPQYELTVYKSRIYTSAGGTVKAWNNYSFPEKKWTHITMAYVKGASKVYINGDDIENLTVAGSVNAPFSEFKGMSSRLPLALTTIPSVLPLAATASSGSTVTPPSGATTQGQGNAYGTTKDKQGGGASGKNIGRMLIGASYSQSGSTGLNFGGKMDEFVFVRRALSPAEIKGQWRMGNPY